MLVDAPFCSLFLRGPPRLLGEYEHSLHFVIHYSLRNALVIKEELNFAGMEW